MALDIENREISWLAFNERVLQEAMDKSNPLIERIRFLAIYSNNMDEFFRVRVATIKRMVSWKKPHIEGFPKGPEALLGKIQNIVVQQQYQFQQAFQSLVGELEFEGIVQVDENSVSEKEKEEIKQYYNQFIRNSIFPIVMDEAINFPQLRDRAIHLAIKMLDVNGGLIRYALIEIPSDISRFKLIKENEKQTHFIMLDDIIRLHLHDIFAIFDFETIAAYTFKISRDAELDIDNDIALSLIEKMEIGIRKRKKGAPVRFVYDTEMPEDLRDYLTQSIGVTMEENIIAGGKYHNFKDFMNFPNFERRDFYFKPQLPHIHPMLNDEKSIIKKVFEDDLLFHFPYQTFSHVVGLLREASIDPEVTEIKISLYRVAKNSDIVNALINAIKNGKKVTVMFELFARFDEKNNVHWSNVLTENGAKVLFGIPGLKVHSKLILISKNSGKIGYVGTGNFNGETAKLYEDYGLMTSNESLTNEIVKVFKLIENKTKHSTFHHLMVSPLNTRKKIIQLIDNEIDVAKKGKKAQIRLKLNNLVDSKLIKKLYEASEAGVKIRIILRGICALKPQVKHQSENIEIISIVGRYLEHSRVLIFENQGKHQIFISSADWMERNLDKRIEVSAPILNEEHKKQIITVFEIQWKDTLKARIINTEQQNKYRKHKDSMHEFNAQQELYDYYSQNHIIELK